jgi:hypothetical protein
MHWYFIHSQLLCILDLVEVKFYKIWSNIYEKNYSVRMVIEYIFIFYAFGIMIADNFFLYSW